MFHQRAVLRRFGSRSRLSIHLVEGSKGLVPGSSAAIGREIRQKCRAYPVTFHLGERVESITKKRVRLSSGQTLKSDLTLWTGGAAPSPLLFECGLASQENAWADVEPSLQSEHFENVFVIGDAAGLPGGVSKQAYHAMDMGSHAAGNIRRYLASCALKPFKPGPEISLISLGNLDTYLVFGKQVFAGPALAPLKELIFQVNMARLDPPLRPSSAMKTQARYWQGLNSLAIPALWPPSSLLRLADLRKLA